MLSTRIPSIKVPTLFQLRFENLSNHLKTRVFEYGNNEIANDFYEEFCEFISDFYAAIERNHLAYATSIIQQFFTKWVQSSQFPESFNAVLEYSISSAISSLIICHLAVQLAYITHYSLAMCCGLILLSITVGIKITTAEWSSVGTLSGGLFKCKIFKSSSTFKNSYRSFKY